MQDGGAGPRRGSPGREDQEPALSEPHLHDLTAALAWGLRPPQVSLAQQGGTWQSESRQAFVSCTDSSYSATVFFLAIFSRSQFLLIGREEVYYGNNYEGDAGAGVSPCERWLGRGYKTWRNPVGDSGTHLWPQLTISAQRWLSWLPQYSSPALGPAWALLVVFSLLWCDVVGDILCTQQPQEHSCLDAAMCRFRALSRSQSQGDWDVSHESLSSIIAKISTFPWRWK